MEDAESRMSQSMRQSWEDDTILRDGVLPYTRPSHPRSTDSNDATAKSSLPVVRHAIRNERVAADNKMDRMTIWMQNVESTYFPFDPLLGSRVLTKRLLQRWWKMHVNISPRRT